MADEQRSPLESRLDAWRRRHAAFKCAYTQALRRLERARHGGPPGEFIAAAMSLDAASINLLRFERESEG
jgi:hypothetical protein